jgi:hypothetical protein
MALLIEVLDQRVQDFLVVAAGHRSNGQALGPRCCREGRLARRRLDPGVQRRQGLSLDEGLRRRPVGVEQISQRHQELLAGHSGMLAEKQQVAAQAHKLG